MTVKDGDCSSDELERLKLILSQKAGKSYQQMEAEVGDSDVQDGKKDGVSYWEEASASEGVVGVSA